MEEINQDLLEKTEELLQISNEVINTSRNVLTLNLRFMDSAISRLNFLPFPLINLSVNGESIIYNPAYIVKSFRDEQTLVSRMILHEILHCVFLHYNVKKILNQEYWNLATDIIVENVINELKISQLDYSRQQEQEKKAKTLKGKVKVFTAEYLYSYFLDNPPSRSEYFYLKEIFSLDDHTIWYLEKEQNGTNSSSADGKGKNNNSSGSGQNGQSSGGGQGEQSSDGGQNGQGKQSSDGNDNKDNQGSGGGQNGQGEQSSDINNALKSDSEKEALAKTWENVAETIKGDMETFSKQRGDTAGCFMQSLKEVTREKYDYSEFLRKFATLEEVMKINDDEFDYIFYTYGLTLYNDMPLIEPLEYKDDKRIRDFVIVIDTSGSVSGDLVQTFLQKTYNILHQEETFSRKINVHIIQCDADIQEDVKITSLEEFERYISTLQLKGFGGTDFRPAFNFVDKLIKDKEFNDLQGLIYFTDGCGVFPEKQPQYKTAFIYIDDNQNDYNVPVWAIKLILKREEIKQ